MGPGNKEFPTFSDPDFFYSDSRVGRIRPPGSNFEQFWYSRTFKKNS